MSEFSFIGPFTQLLPMKDLPVRGPIKDAQLAEIPNAGILLENDKIAEIGEYSQLFEKAKNLKAEIFPIEHEAVAIPGLVDSHTHICYAGSRAKDYALRNSGSSYLEIAREGGGIWDTVQKTRMAEEEELVRGIKERASLHLQNGTTTLEVKSGYGLSVEEELKMLRAIKKVNSRVPLDLIPTCLAAHIHPKDHKGSASEYLEEIIHKLFPKLLEESLSNRIDAFVEEGAFNPEIIRPYLKAARNSGFDLTIHADQFTTGGSALAVEFNAMSADHLEASTQHEIDLLASSEVVATALPGASLGLGCGFTPGRKILDAGGILAIASDHNPGSAPMGHLLTQASIFGAFEKLTNAEVLAGITFRAARALGIRNIGQLAVGFSADLVVFPTGHYNEILYHQGQLKPSMVWKDGVLQYHQN